MPRFFYSTPSFQQYRAPDPWWKRFKRARQRKKALKKIDANLVQIRNPFQHKQEAKPVASGKIKPILLLFVVLAWIVVMLYLPYFATNKSLVEGSTIIKPEEIKDYVNANFLKRKYSWWPRNNYFLISIDKIKKGVEENFAIKEAVVTKIFPDTVKVDIKERIASIIYDNGQKYYVLDINGEIVKTLKEIDNREFIFPNTPSTTASTTNNFNASASSSVVMSNSSSSTLLGPGVHIPRYKDIKKEAGNLPLIYDHRNKKEFRKLEKNIVDSIMTWQETLTKQGIAATYYEIENTAAGLKINTVKRWYILANIQGGNILNSMNNLKLILKDNNPKEYIDLRYGERVYWK